MQVYAKPTGIQKGINGNVWVMCSGRGFNGWPVPDDTEGHLLCIDPGDYSILHDFEFPSTSQHPEKLVADNEGEVLYYNYTDGIYKFNVNGGSLEDEPLIARTAMFYGLGFDAVDNVIYASDPLDYVQNGIVYRYDASNGSVIDSLDAGIIPGEFLFTE